MNYEDEAHYRATTIVALAVTAMGVMAMPWHEVPFMPALTCAASLGLLIMMASLSWWEIRSVPPWRYAIPVGALLTIPFWGAAGRGIEIFFWTHRSPPAVLDPYDVPANYWWGSHPFLEGPLYAAPAVFVGMVIFLTVEFKRAYPKRYEA